MIEFPAGLANDTDEFKHESLEEAARRELIEETGYAASNLELIVRTPGSSSIATDMLSVYFATGLAKIGPGGGDASENITVHEVPLKEIHEWLEGQKTQGKYVDLKVYSGLYYLQNHTPRNISERTFPGVPRLKDQ